MIGSLRRLPAPIYLLLAGLISELIYLFAIVRPWWLWDHFPPGSGPYLFGDKEHLLAYGFAMTGLFAVYGAACWLVQRRPSREAELLIFAFAVVFAVGLLLAYPVTSADVYHYIMEGRILWLHGDNPLVAVPGAYPTDPYLPYVDRFHHFSAAPYGPLWVLLVGVPTALPDEHPELVLVGFKALVTAFYLGTAALIWLTLREVSPANRAFGLAVFAWNPLILLSVATNGHNDIVMMFFVAGAIYLAAKGWWRWAIPVLVLSGMVKYVTFLLLPLFVLYAWRRLPQQRRDVVIGCLAGAAAAIVLFAPFWEGLDTFSAQRSDQRSWFINSFSEVALIGLGKVISVETAMDIVRVASTLATLALLALALFWMRPAANGFLLASYQLLFLYLLVASTLVYPWYVVWPLVLAAVLLDRVWVVTAIVLSFTAVFADIITNMVTELHFLRGDTGWGSTVTVLVTLVPPLLVWLGIALHRFRRQRLTPFAPADFDMTAAGA
ncbi:MAG TPA: hypothetical protein VFB90_01575 [Dehalococcoidia bacterium]|nr:hypothetical protein [Dehalococcoidia bacterium]